MDLSTSHFLNFITSSGLDVSDLILKHIVKGEGGPQTILNLRKVCSTTRDWIDNLLPAQANAIFSKIPASVYLSRKTLQEFLQCPSPPKVTHLKIYNVEFFEDLTAEEKRLFKQFAAFWSPKLKFLEANVPEEILLDAFKFYPLSALRFYVVHIFHHRMLEVNELEIRILKLDDQDELEFFNAMQVSLFLKRLSITANTPSLIERCTRLINTRTNDIRFELEVNVTIQDDVDIEEQPLIDFVLAVARSQSCINILQITDKTLLEIISITPESIYTEFCKKVICIQSQTVYTRSTNIADLFKRNLFPNLKRLDDEAAEDQDRMEFTRTQDLPRGLKWLKIAGDNFNPKFLPQNLTHLNLSKQNWTASELQDALIVIGETCRVLNKLTVVWLCKRPVEAKQCKKNQICLFPTLKSLTLDVDFTYNTTTESTRLILFDIMNVDKLQLLKLKFEGHIWDNSYSRMSFDADIIQAFLNSPVLMKSLVRLQGDGILVNDEALPLREQLQAVVEENHQRRVQVFGRQRRPRACYE